MSGDVNKMLGQAYLRSTAGLFVSVFGSSEQRERVGRLVDGKLSVEEAESVREWLDKVANRLTGGR